MGVTKQELIQSAACQTGSANVKIRGYKEPQNLPALRLEEELKSCMGCRHFYGSRRQCILSDCTGKETKGENPDTRHTCHQCPYRVSERYCFPCMRKIIGQGREKKEDEDGEPY